MPKKEAMKLIGSTSSPYVRKVRVVMAEKKLDYGFVLEDVWADDTTIAHSNPLGKVPCLVMEGGEALFDSRVIVEYLDTLSPVGKLIPVVGREQAQRSEAWIERQLDKVNASLKAMSQGLGEKPFCAGIYLSLADIAVGCALGYLDFRFPEIDWRAGYPNLAKLQDKLMQRQSFTDTRPA